MNDAPDQSGSAFSDGEAKLAKLNAQVAAMRLVLVQLLQEIAVAEARLDHGAANLLVKANEQLILSALSAQVEVDTAHGALDEASRAAGIDPLTGLPNRTFFLDRFQIAISNARRHGKRVALLFLDLDAFKQINDRFGHASGDHALQQVAQSLSALVRETDTVSRHGGDEFLVLLAEVASMADAEVVADKVNGALGSHTRNGGQPLRLSASIGISIYPEDGEDAKTLIACADAKMYAVKKQALSAAVNGGMAHESATPSANSHDARQHASAQEHRERDLRDANESLVLAALGAQTLLAAAEEARRRQGELLSLVAHELSDPHAPIRQAASSLGIGGAEAKLLPRARVVIEQQADRLARMVRKIMEA